MLNKLNASEKLYLLVSIMFIFIIGTGVYGIIEMKTMNQDNKTLYADRVLALEQLTTVRYSYLVGVISSAEQTQARHRTFKETVTQIDDAEKSIDANWHAYLQTYLTVEETRLAKQAAMLMGHSQKVVEKLKVILNKEDAHALDDFINNELYPTLNPVIAKLNELIDLQVGVGGEVYKSSNELYNSSLKQFSFLMVLSLLLAIPISYYLVRNIRYLISDLQASNTKIAESEERYRSLIEHAGDAIFVLADDLSINNVNTSASKLLGYSHQEFLGKKITDLFDKKELEKRPVQSVALRESRTLLSERILRRKDGTEVEVEFNIRLLEGKGHLSIARDITERKQEEVLLRESEDRFSKAFRAAPVGMAITRISDGKFFEVNEAFEKSLGYDRSELIGRTTKDLNMWSNPGDRGFLLDELARKESAKRPGSLIRTKDDRIAITNISAEVIELGEEKCILSVHEDVTEQKRIEESLRESEKKYRNIFENVQDVFYQTSLTGVILDVSPSIKNHTGYTREELIGTNASNLFYNLADREKGLRVLWEKGEIKDYEILFKSSAGEPVYVSLNAVLIPDADGIPTHQDGSFRNITERKNAEEKIKQSEARLKEAQAIAHIGNWEIDIVNDVHTWSDETYKIFGVSKDELKPSTEALLSFIHPEDRGGAQEEIGQAFVTLIDSSSTFRFMRKGEDVIRYALIEWRFECNENKQPMRLYGILQDITERKKAEQRIKQSEANYRQLFKLSPAPMWAIDDETYSFTEVNQACLNNYGYSEEEFAEMTIVNISSQDNKTDIKNTALKNQATTFFMDGQRHIKKSGELIDVETSSIPVIINGKKQILVIAIDVTEKNLYEQKLRRAAIKAQEEERYEIGGELHDNVCQILAGSLIFLGMMKKDLPPGSKEYFENTQQYIKLASQEIRSLSHRLAPAFFDDATLVDAFQSLLKGFNVEKKYEINLDFDKASRSLPLDRDLQLNLYRILQEQLRNILKHANATSIDVEVSLINNDTLQMQITDNGVGFDVKSNKGGIGFANMNRRAQLFSGNVTVDSVVGNGCKILVRISLSVNK